MPLIIRDQLVTPPTWFMSFRDLTLYCNVFLKAEIVIESDDPDPYWKWMKPRGGMDFIEDFVRPGSQTGIHLDFERKHPQTIPTDRIVPENLDNLIRRLKGCSGSLR